MIISVGEYQDQGYPSLARPVSDAGRLRDVLIQEYGFRRENITELVNAQATAAGIDRELRGLTRLGKNDNVLIYYAGHGEFEESLEHGFWVPYDGRARDPSSWVAFATLAAILRSPKIVAKSLLLITDSCYGGELTIQRSGPVESDELLTAHARLLRALNNGEAVSRKVMASGGAKQKVDDASMFSQTLIDALERARTPLVDLSEIFRTRILPAMNNVPTEQSPQMAALSAAPDQGGQFVLVRQSADHSLIAEDVFLADEPAPATARGGAQRLQSTPPPRDIAADALAAARSGKCGAALKDLETASRLDRGNEELHYEFGRCAIELGDCSLAVEPLSEALKVNPGRGENWAQRGRAYACLDLLDMAIADYGEAIQIQGDPAWVRARGELYDKSGDLQSAVAHYAKLAKIAPADCSAHKLLGEALVRNGDQTLGAQSLEKAAALGCP